MRLFDFLFTTVMVMRIYETQEGQGAVFVDDSGKSYVWEGETLAEAFKSHRLKLDDSILCRTYTITARVEGNRIVSCQQLYPVTDY